jgi:hypothetical protein
MAKPLDKDVSEAPEDDRPGRVEFDSRGNSVWRWARDVLDSTTIMLKRLENKDLSLEPTQKVPVVGKTEKSQKAHAKANTAAAAARGPAQPGRPGKPAQRRELDIEGQPRDSGGGFDPYNSR